MNRYCPNCHKEFDFPIRSMEDLDNLVCPECGGKIDRNSRRPIEEAATERTEEAIGRTISTLTYIGYIFYALLSSIGIAAYFLGWSGVLRLMTGICLAVFLIQQFIGTQTFWTGLFFLPLGAAAGFLLLRSLDGACLGVCAVFIIRHVLWNIVSRLLGKLIGLANRP